jgi:hypothetical protein
MMIIEEKFHVPTRSARDILKDGPQEAGDLS